MKSEVYFIHNEVLFQRTPHPGECSPEKDCLRSHWLTFRQPQRKLSSESSGNRHACESAIRKNMALRPEFWVNRPNQC